MIDDPSGSQDPSREEEQKLRAAVEAAEQASRAKSQFLAEVSHEIRTQLAGILGMAQVTLDTKLTPQQREYIELVTTSADALLTLVNDLLDLSKIESGHLNVEQIPFNLADTLRDTVTSMTVAAEGKGIALDLQLAEDVPAHVIGDPGRLRQIVLNLIANGMRFTDQGGVTVEGSVESASSREIVVHLKVVDTGDGIPADQLEAIFEAYTQADRSSERKRRGTGLGLSISRQLVEVMGGKIWAESEPGHGSIFHVMVPLELAAEGIPSPSSPGRSDLQGLPILLVAENPVNQGKLLDAISATDMQPTAVSTSDEAMARLADARQADRPFALTVCDMNGGSMELAERIRSDDSLAAMHLIVLTSVGQRGDAAVCRELNVGGYLTKPMPAEDLRLAVEAVIAGPSPLDLTVLVTKHWLRERRRHLNILVVDDSPTHRMVARRLLDQRGHRVSALATGQEAIEAVRIHRFDVVLLDLWMPGMGGFETAAGIRAIEDPGERVPIVAMSTDTVMELAETLAEADMDGVIAKPFQVPQLLRAIESIIDGQSMPPPMMGTQTR